MNMMNISEKCKHAESLIQKADVIYFKYKNEYFNTDNLFNVFSLLRKEHDEVQLHSKFIGELLNPNGSHYSKGDFLELFLNNTGIKNFIIPDQNTGIEVCVEKSIDAAGRIDIFIYNPNAKQVIIVENKIYAGDQEEQLMRYYRYAHDVLGCKQEDIWILYLTLDGCDASEISKLDVPEVVLNNISYKENIDKWLKECIKASALKPIIRETLRQYQNLVRKLTGNPMSDDYIKDLKKLLAPNSEYIYLADEISQALTKVKIDIQKKFWQELREELSCAGYNIYKFRDISNNNYSKVSAYYESSRPGSYGLSIVIDRDGNDKEANVLVFYIGVEAKELFMGIAVVDDKNSIQQKVCQDAKYNSIYAKLNNVDKELSRNDHWIGWKYVEDKNIFDHVSKRNVLTILDDKERKQYVENLTNEVKKLVNEIKSVI